MHLESKLTLVWMETGLLMLKHNMLLSITTA